MKPLSPSLQTIVTLLFISLFLMQGCARVEKVRAMEGDFKAPYDSLGTLEVKTKAPYLTLGGSFWTSVEAVSLGVAKTPSRGEHYKRRLRSKLAKIASRRYSADAVIKVIYWPDPESKRFPDGSIHARGEMIRYRSFPSESQ